MELTDLQRVACDLACKGHNLVITGQAGTGKTFIVRKILDLLGIKGKTTSVVCSTGLACSNFSAKYGAKTLHSWAGFMDCRHTRDVLLTKIKKNEDYKVVLNRIRGTDVLVIDEISMISAKLLADLEHIARNVKGENLWFGGMQVILSGDFYQLPPVPNRMSGDNGQHCFEWTNFGDAFPHTVNLTKVLRQQE